MLNTNLNLNQTSNIKSYVLRQGRITAAQQRALKELWSRYGVEISQVSDSSVTAVTDSSISDVTSNGENISPPNWETIFAKPCPLSLEIGAGYGEATIALAQKSPHINHIAIEVHLPAIGALLNSLAAQKIENVRIIRGDIAALLPQLFSDNTLDCVRIFFPDPWQKKRHHKRRLINSAFLARLTQKIKIGGFIHIATDWANYAEIIRQCLQEEPALNETALNENTAAFRPPSRFGNRAIKDGRNITDFVAVRIK